MAGPQDSTLNGGAGDDVLIGGAGNDILHGGTGDDYLNGGGGVNQLYGDEGNDLLIGTNHDAVLSGGTGGETDFPSPLPVTGFYGDVLMLSHSDGPSTVVNTDFERIYGSDFGDVIDSSGFTGGGAFAGRGVTVFGGSGNDSITGSIYNDELHGGAGNDTIEGLAGADTLDGGSGNNTLSYEHSPAGVNVSLLAHSASGGDAAGDVFTNFQNITGSQYSDVLMGDNEANVLIGLGGNDYLIGLAGNDTLVGGTGNDTMEGGAGDDTLIVGGGANIVDGGPGNDRIELDYNNGLNVNAQLFGGPGIDTFVFHHMYSTIEGTEQLDPARVAAVEAYMGTLRNLNHTDWDPGTEPLEYRRD
jgi:Ca2+-binding RTX toxin-like protein